ncbi:MAG: reverse gyrase [Aquificaceae bacterium]
MLRGVFRGLCPNCGGDISSERLERGLACEKCMPEGDDPCEVLKNGRLFELCKVDGILKSWKEHFRKYTGFEPWALQISWAYRVFIKSSFALLAPTGVGKSTFGISMASFLSKIGKNSYIIVPTQILVRQTRERLLAFGVSEADMLVFSDESGKRKELLRERLKSGDFKILVSTSMFLYKNFQDISCDFDLIFVDDVDSFLKTSTNVDKVLKLMNFTDSDIQNGMKILKLKSTQNRDQETFNKIKELQSEIQRVQKRGALVISSATSAPRSLRAGLFREMLGFDLSSPNFFVRKTVDIFDNAFKKHPIDWIKELGKGCLLFVSSDYSKKGLDMILKSLNQEGIRAISYEELNEKTIEEFSRGDIWVIGGISSYKNPLARGFDLPKAVRYAIFYGVPKIVLSLKFEKNLSHVLWAISSLRPIIAKKMPQVLKTLDNWIEKLRRYQYLSEEFLSQRQELYSKVEALKEEVLSFLRSKEVLEILENSPETTIRSTQDGYVLSVSDVVGYLQASGRVSRMYLGGLTTGLSLILVDDERVFNHLQKKIGWFSEDIEFKPAKDVDLKRLMEIIDQERAGIRAVNGEKPREDFLKPTLFIVESPNKARTIANFFGKPARRKVNDLEVLEVLTGELYLLITSCFGHVLDLSRDGGTYGVLKNSIFEPLYEPIEKRHEIISGLQRLAREARDVLIATDPDSEGEKIAWDLRGLLRPFNKNILRVEFHEITKRAILNALSSPRDINLNLVEAQALRRIADRWVGFEFSQKLQQAFSKSWLSAGRVQTPVLGWIIDRDALYRKKLYRVSVSIPDGPRLEWRFESKNQAESLVKALEDSYLELISSQQEERNPPPPLATHSLLKLASERLRWSAEKTMKVAQSLFETGFITYHRTDSIRVSGAGIALAKELSLREYPEEVFRPRTWAEGGAHECIRPTRALEPEELRSIVLSGQVESLPKEAISLYGLIFRHFLASQLRPAILEIQNWVLKAGDFKHQFTVVSKILQNGYNIILPIQTMSLKEGKVVLNPAIDRVPSEFLYTSGEIVSEMKRQGIGRPSTYASTLEKLLERGYVIESSGFLVPTKLGKIAYKFLSSDAEVSRFVSVDFTKEIEEMMDRLEQGEEDFQRALDSLYTQIFRKGNGRI